MKKQTNLDFAFLMMLAVTLFVSHVLGQTTDKIRYNAVYDCGEGKLKFKVLNCAGKGGDAECTVFNINEYAPGGGHQGIMSRSTIEDNFVGVCAVAGGNDASQNQSQDNQNASQTPDTPAANNGKFKVGDRVQVTISGSKDEKNYQPCTIVRDLEHNSYGIGCDPWRGQPYLEYSVLPSWVRPWANAMAANFPTAKLNVDENETVLANRELTDCGNFNHNGRNGSAPPTDLAKKLIRCLYERPSPVGQDGATTMDITAFTIGAPHRWNLNEDLGQGNLNTLVYPVRVKWNMETFYRTRNIQVTDKQQMFTCFVDTTNLWQCGTAAGSHQDGKTQEIVVKNE